MSDDGPNPQQETLIDATDGIHLVDAGAGTGKTYTITRRYANLPDQEGIEPEDILVITFTNNAAEEMKERIVTHCDYGMADLRDAPINTFHGYCNEILTTHGFEAPELLGFDDRLTSSTQIVEDEVIERERFREFLRRFAADHPEYHEFLTVLSDRTSLLDLIKELAAKGVFPTREGWFRNGEAFLDGDFEAFSGRFEAANGPGDGASGPTQSDLLGSVKSRRRNKCYLPDAPSWEELHGGIEGKQLAPELRDDAFDEDRGALKTFVHDVYFEYVSFALGRNYLNFSFLLMFAFALLCEDDRLRDELAFDHVMVDEFQDTSEIQFKLALLLAGEPNICVVGDWKQSIYSFQYAAVENILHFEERLQRFKSDLNADRERITFPVDEVNEIPLRENYRSTESILTFSEHSLTLPAADGEDLDTEAIRDEITSLEAATDYDGSTIESFTAEEEYDAILHQVQEIVGNDDYEVRDEDGTLRSPKLKDIAVLTRVRRFGRELQHRAKEYGIPMAYEGGVDLFDTDHAKLLLAWLRILDYEHSRRGWAVVLEEAGYRLDEVQRILERRTYPEEMLAFRDRLETAGTIGAVARIVFDRYGFQDAYADALISVLESTFASTHRNRGEVIQFIERGLRTGATHDVDDSPGSDSVTVQTIHAAKGLEHPIVLVANVNEHNFPPSGGGDDAIRYEDPIGLRQTTLYAEEHGSGHRYHNWRYDVLSAALPTEYDEERRLMYVAMTRARDHLLFFAGSSPSNFFEGLPLDPEAIDPDVERADEDRTEQARLLFSIPEPTGPVGRSPHSLMEESVYEDVEEGMGPEYGQQVHDFAEAYAEGEDVTPSNSDEENVQALLDSLEGELITEEYAHLPLSTDGERVTISGIVDLLCITPEAVAIVDYKTDRGRHAQSEYRKQLSVYHYVVQSCYPERTVSASIYYTATGDRVTVSPLSKAELCRLALGEEG
jgi:superfamily I DNA/RNA helicase